MQNIDKSILLVGSGPMAIEYAKVLKQLNKEFIVVGRSKDSAEEFKKSIGMEVITGGVDNYIKQNQKISQTAIVAVSEEQLGIVTRKLMQHGVKLILVEKPAGLDFKDIKEVEKLAKKLKINVYVGYNRRFYSSVKKAKEIIKKDRGILSIFFDFTEASFRITPLQKAPGVKENWFLQNSTHVIDLAFYLTGNPRMLCAFTSGSLSWHPNGAVFSGAGISENGALFAYQADWNAPGRWSLEVMTKNNKLIFKPMEKLQVQKLGTFEIKDLQLNDALDLKFKAGIYREIQSFLGNKQNLCTISEQVENLKFYKQILEGKS